MCLRRAPEKYIAGAALDRAGVGVLTRLSRLIPYIIHPTVQHNTVHILKEF
jgi:hypothetical protein